MTSAPGARSRSAKKTPGEPSQSTWPAMIAGPSSPGVGAPVYQPAGKPSGGTSSEPSDCNPRSISPESTPMAGIPILTGVEAAIGAGPVVAASAAGGSMALVRATEGAVAGAGPLEQAAVMTASATARPATPHRGRRARRL